MRSSCGEMLVKVSPGLGSENSSDVGWLPCYLMYELLRTDLVIIQSNVQSGCGASCWIDLIGRQFTLSPGQ